MKPLLPVAACSALITLAIPALAIQTDNHGIHAIPAPANLKIDGKLDDWDLSGAVLMTYDIETLKDVYSAQVALMYDAQNLYVGLHWKDATPMGNSHDPRYQANKAWAGDAVQFRIKTDRISHVTAWYYAPKQEPGLFIDYGNGLTRAFGGGNVQLFRTQGTHLEQGAEMAFQKDADGKGYAQEVKLPWKLITQAKVPTVGEQFNMGFELLYGEADWPVHRYADNLSEGSSGREFFFTNIPAWGPVFLEPKGNLKLPEPAYMVAYKQALQGDSAQGPVEIKYTLPAEARVTLAIEDENGNRVRNLVAALPRNKGANVEKWDGLDDNGKPVAPGNYRYKAIYHDAIHTSYVMSYANPGNPSWSTPDGRGAFYGDHTAPHAVAAAGDYVGLACPMGEAGQPLIGADLNGQRLWGQANRIFGGDGISSLATDGKILWVASEGKSYSVYRVEIATGKYAPWNLTAKDEAGREYRVLELPVATPDPSNSPNYQEVSKRNLSAISVRDGVLAVCLQRENVVKLLDSETGALRSTVTVPSPRSVVQLAGGALIVLSQGRLMSVAPDGTCKQLGDLTFPEAYGIAGDAVGNIYLSVRGADQNVKVLSAGGELLREIGLRGGRPLLGAYLENGMRNPSQIAVDSRNHLWVTEETHNPKRTSVWDAATGVLVKDLAGTTSYAGAGAINPDDPTMAFADNTVYKINLAAGTSKPVYSLGKRDDAADVFPPEVQGITTRSFNHDGKSYTWSRSGTCVMFDGTNWRSAARIGTVVRDKNRNNTQYVSPLFDGHEGESFAWADKNGDGLVQADELTFAPMLYNGKTVPLTSFYWGSMPGPDGTLTYAIQSTQTLLQFAIVSYNAVGAPVYDIKNPKKIEVQSKAIRVGEGEGMLVTGVGGTVYLNQTPLVGVDRDGKVLGTYPSNVVSVHGSHNATTPRPGYLIGPSSFLGTAVVPGLGEVFYLNGNLGQNYLFTGDGLWIQSLFKDTRGSFDTPNTAVRGQNWDDTTAGGESFGGNFIRANDGNYYLTLGGTDAHVLQVTGLDSIKRFDGKVAYSAAQYSEAQALVQQRAAIANVPKVFTVARAAAPVQIDGKATEWPELLDDTRPLAEIQDDPRNRFARVAARYDADNLYLGYRVFAPRSQMKNGGQDDRLLFKTGDAVDLMLGGVGAKNGAGNLRLLMTMEGGQPVAVLNVKTAPGAAPGEKFAFSSPWRTINFDRVVKVPEVKMSSGPIQGGYFVEAAIPWTTLGIKPGSGLKLRGDFGALFADNGGNVTVARQYWSNKSTGLVNDVPGEADLEPGLWGTLTLE